MNHEVMDETSRKHHEVMDETSRDTLNIKPKHHEVMDETSRDTLNIKPEPKMRDASQPNEQRLKRQALPSLNTTPSS